MAGRFLRAGITNPISTWRDFQVVQHYRRAQEELRESAEPLAAAQLRIAGERAAMPLAQAKTAIEHWMEDAPLDLLASCLRPGIVELLEAAKRKSIPMGVLSDYPADRKLAAMRIDSYFSTVLAAQDARIGMFKPSPKGLLEVLADLGVSPDAAIYVGDRASVDGEAARRAGVNAVILGSSKFGQGWVGAPDVPALRRLLNI